MNLLLKKISELSKSEKENLENDELITKIRRIWKYKSGSIEYYQEYYSSYINNSFIVYMNNKPIALSYIYMENKISYFGMPIEIFFKNNDIHKNILKKVFNYIESISNNKSYNIYYNSSISYYLEGLETIAIKYSNEFKYNVYPHKGLDYFKSNLRKSYKSLVNWCHKNIKYRIVDHKSLDHDEFWKLMNFHIEVSGKMTRSKKSWEIQKKMIEENQAFLINGYMEDSLISSSLFFLRKETYYGVGVYDRELMNSNIGIAHGAIHRAVKYLENENKTDRLCLGFWLDSDSMNQKEKQILNFKRGFTNKLETENIININHDI